MVKKIKETKTQSTIGIRNTTTGEFVERVVDHETRLKAEELYNYYYTSIEKRHQSYLAQWTFSNLGASDTLKWVEMADECGQGDVERYLENKFFRVRFE